jgi:4-hydroxy 2-oxovalerate aldolase
MVLAYALSVATSGLAARILMAGFDGYEAGDPRNNELNQILETFSNAGQSPDCISITPTRFKLKAVSVYAI